MRKTSETNVSLSLLLDGSGRAEVECGIPFFEHMLTLFCSHGCFDIVLKAEGDLEVDAHHLVEDIGLVLGQAFDDALGDRAGISATAALSCRWMKPWYWWRRIFRDARILSLICPWLQPAWAALKRNWWRISCRLLSAGRGVPCMSNCLTGAIPTIKSKPCLRRWGEPWTKLPGGMNVSGEFLRLKVYYNCGFGRLAEC